MILKEFITELGSYCVGMVMCCTGDMFFKSLGLLYSTILKIIHYLFLIHVGIQSCVLNLGSRFLIRTPMLYVVHVLYMCL